MKYLKLYNDLLTENLEMLSMESRGRLITALTIYSVNETLTEEEKALYLSGEERFVWPSLRQNLDREIGTYSRISDRNKINGAKHKGKAASVNQEPSGTQWVIETEQTEEHQNPVGPSGLKDKDKDKEKDNNKEKEKEKEKEKDHTLSQEGYREGYSLKNGTLSAPSEDEVVAFFIEHNNRPELDPEGMAQNFIGYHSVLNWTDPKTKQSYADMWQAKAVSWIKNEKGPSQKEPKAKREPGRAWALMHHMLRQQSQQLNLTAWALTSICLHWKRLSRTSAPGKRRVQRWTSAR